MRMRFEEARDALELSAMGTWGNKLFDDDTACDVRDEYVRLLSGGHPGPNATDRLLDRWKDTVDDRDEGPVFWPALAVTQHKHGQLEARVKERALSVTSSTKRSAMCSASDE